MSPANPNPPADATILESRGLRKVFGQGDGAVEAVAGVDLSVRRGEFLAVMGPSGCGKSTLLHLLGLLTTPTAGQVLIDGQDVAGLGETARATIRRTRTGFVFQRFNLLGVLNGYDNIRLSMQVRGRRDDRRIDQLLEEMGIALAARRKPGKMSIGQQQRLALARAVAHCPDVLLADEPTGSLDTRNADGILQMLSRENRQRGQTIVMITHSPAVAAAAGRIVYMQDGRIIDHNPF